MNENNKRNCIVSFANSNGYYVDRLARLSNSLRDNFDGDFLGFIGEKSINAPLHSEVPYGFKIKAIERALDAGYRKILWLDSSVFAVANVKKIFDDIEKNGIVFQDAGHYLGNWANDYTLSYFEMNRNYAMGLKMIGNAGFLGIDHSSTIGDSFFYQWKASMINGCFKGEWGNDKKTESEDGRCSGHRHDMSCSSAIVHKMGIFNLAYSGEEVLQYAGIYDKVLNDTIILKAQG